MSGLPLRILLVEDNDIYRRSLRELLATEGRFEVVGEAATAEDAVLQAASARPDVVVMDLRIAAANGTIHSSAGLGAMARIIKGRPDVAVLILSTLPDAAPVREAMSAGDGKVVALAKDAPAAAILAAIHAVGQTQSR